MNDKEKFLSCIDTNSKYISKKAINKEFNCGLKDADIWYEAFIENNREYLDIKEAFQKFIDMINNESITD